jgi:hypothetical protein
MIDALIVGRRLIGVKKMNRTELAILKFNINELIDKATPKKVLPLREKEYGYGHQCPTCKSYVGTIIEDGVEYDNYCCSCGQKLDWSDEYE